MKAFNFEQRKESQLQKIDGLKGNVLECRYGYEEKKIESKNLHGTGCTLSSAIASYLAKGYSMKESIRHAKEYITHAIIAGKDLNIGHGNGPLWHFPDSIAQMCTFCEVVS